MSRATTYKPSAIAGARIAAAAQRRARGYDSGSSTNSDDARIDEVNRALEREDYARFVGDYYDNYLARFKDFGLESPTTEGATSPAPAPARGLDARAPEFKYPARVAADAAVGWTAEDEARFDELEALIEAEAAREVEEAERATGPYSPTVPARDSDALVRAVRAGDLNRVAHMVEFLDFPVTHAVIDAAMESDDPTIASYLLRHFEEEGADEAEAAAAAAEGRGAAQRSHVHRAAATGDLWVGGEGGGSGAEEEEEEEDEEDGGVAYAAGRTGSLMQAIAARDGARVRHLVEMLDYPVTRAALNAARRAGDQSVVALLTGWYSPDAHEEELVARGRALIRQYLCA